MGRNKKGFNWKARQVVKTVIEETRDKVEIDLPGISLEKYDESNALLLPSKKRKAKIVREKITSKKILSKNQRKKLEKIVEAKKKKENRQNLLEALAEVQATPQELALMTSLTSVQTKGLKRIFTEDATCKHEEVDDKKKVNSLAGSGKKRKKDLTEDQTAITTDLNVVGFDVSDESDSNEEEQEEEQVEEVECIETNRVNDTEEKQIDNNDGNEANSNLQNMDTKKKEDEDVSRKQSNQTTCDSVKSIPSTKQESKPAVYVPVFRTAKAQASRLKLPILAEEQAIVEAINGNPVVILAGETGSGKTTQVPQFLYEAGYATNGRMIGITEPRRVAATSMANRVAEEMNLHDGEVAYQIRFEGNTKENTRIKFMTDGVLLKEVQKDFLLNNYSVIIIDEAHERSVYSDILLGLLSRIVAVRKKRGNPLKLVIMSATLRVEDFTNNLRLFKIKPPVVQVESRQFPVTIHFNKRTAFEDYVSEAFRKVCKIHRQLPDGGILVFLTGQQEVNALCRKLKSTFPGVKAEDRATSKTRVDSNDAVRDKEFQGYEEEEDMEEVMNKIKKKRHAMKTRKKEVDSLPKINLDHYSALPLQDLENEIDGIDDEDLGDLISDEDNDLEEANLLSQSKMAPPLWVLPLYSLLPSHRQQRVFQPPPEGFRLCVVATNVAETSLTIPNIRYVVDSGRVKAKFYDKVTGVSSFQVTWTSQAAANQRAGRAGRTGPGHCYRLYSSAVFNDEFEKYSVPDIARRPIEDLVLQMKAMDIDKVIHFPFPTPPDVQQLCAAEDRLILLGALEQPPQNLRLKESGRIKWSTKITALGRAMAAYPVAPRYAKMLLLSQQHNLLQLTITLVSALSVQELLLDHPVEANQSETYKKWISERRTWAGAGNSLLLGDPMVLLRAVGAAEYAGANEEFCSNHGIRSKGLREVRKLRVQLTNETNTILPSNYSVGVDPQMTPPTDLQSKLLRQILLAGSPDHVARKIRPEEIKEAEDKRKFKHAYRTPNMEDPVFLNPSSVLKSSAPDWIVYQDIYESQKIYLRGITAIEPEWLPIFCPSLCTFSLPLENPPPRYIPDKGRVVCHMNVTFGRSGWPLPLMELDYPAGLDRCKWFAKFFLDGTVCPLLAKYTNVLLSPPSSMVKTWARLQPRTQILLQSLTNRSVDNLESLLSVWQQDKLYLLDAYRAWLPESLHGQVALQWPPL